MHSQMTCAGWLFIRVSASLGVFQQVSLLSYTVLFHTDGLDLTMTTDCESVGRPASFHRFLRHSLVFLLTVYAHILQILNFNISSRRKSLLQQTCMQSGLQFEYPELFYSLFSVQFYPIVVSVRTNQHFPLLSDKCARRGSNPRHRDFLVIQSV